MQYHKIHQLRHLLQITVVINLEKLTHGVEKNNLQKQPPQKNIIQMTDTSRQRYQCVCDNHTSIDQKVNCQDLIKTKIKVTKKL